MIVNQPVARGGGGRGEVTTAPLSRELAERTAETLQAAADDLVKLYKRISLDDDLDDHLRSELMSQLSSGAMATSGTLRLVSGGEMNSHGEIASAAMVSGGEMNSHGEIAS